MDGAALTALPRRWERGQMSRSALPTPNTRQNRGPGLPYDKAVEIRRSNTVVEPLLSGIVLGLVPVTLAGLFVAAYLQYRRGNQFDL
jgi:cytochrome b6-f complex subunit 5